MVLEIKDAYTRREDVRGLFDAYTEALIEGDPRFRHYLDLQNYDRELDELEARYGRPRGRLLVAYADGLPVGCIALKEIDSDTCELKRLYVYPQRRGSGIAKALVGRLITEAREIGYKRMRLDTLPFLEAAIHVYRSFGFQTVAPYNDNPMRTSIYMMLEL